jgi:hypothetical protein
MTFVCPLNATVGLASVEGEEEEFIFVVGTDPFIETRYQFTHLTTVVCGDKVHINRATFQGSVHLESVTMGDCCTLNSYAFRACGALRSVTMGERGTLNHCAFGACARLTTIVLGASCEVGVGAFAGCGIVTLSLVKVGHIDAYAFDECTALVSVSAPDTDWIGYAAFRGCTALTRVHLPSRGLVLNDLAFAGCSRLASIVLPPGAVVGGGAFTQCALHSVHIPVGAVVSNSAFADCPLAVATVESEATPTFTGCELLYVAAKDTCRGLYHPLTDATRRRAAGLTLCTIATLKQVRLPPAGRARLLLVLCIAERLKHTPLALPAEMWFAITACFTVPELCAVPSLAHMSLVHD